MNQWNQYTLFRLLVGYTAGGLVYTSSLFTGSLPLWIYATLVLVLMAARFLIKKYALYKNRYLIGITIMLLMIALGYEWSRIHDKRNDPSSVGKIYEGSEPLIVQVTLPVETRSNSYKTVAKVVAVEKDSSWIETSGKIMLYFPKDSLSATIQYGDRLIVYSALVAPAQPANPGEFDYGRYLARKNIHFQSFVRTGEWVRIGSGYGMALMSYSIQLRNKFVRIFEKNNITDRNFAVVNALVLGYDDHLDNETRKEFSAAGAMHILCVSGLHVGIIFLVLNGMLFFLKRNRLTRFLKSMLVLAGIWLYALITGLSPSVLRATTMFSFVIVGSLLNRPGHIYNSLSASAFLLLLINPFLLQDVGFQLSYSAVLSIVSVQPLLHNLWVPESKLVDKIWSLVTVSVAAQIGTFPLGLYYFHQFPNYFIITNLVVIPLATLILYAGFLVVIVSFIPILSYWISQVLILLLKTLNSSVTFIDQLPYSASSGIFVSFATVLLFYLLIFGFFRAWTTKKPMFLKFAIVVAIFIAATAVVREYQWQKQKKVVVYSVKNDAAIDLIERRNNIFLASSANIENLAGLEYNILGNRVQSGIRNTWFVSLDSLYFNPLDGIGPDKLQASDPFFIFADKNFVLITNEFPYAYLTDTLYVDVALIYDDNRTVSEGIFRMINPKNIVITNKVPYRALEAWRQACEASGKPYHIIREKGAFELVLAP
ncbi:MAG: ComEC/Rec2 family competence protein [Bacteroidales bacterium]|nr:ComEC/Rec2 family competence protein [Bacteroidales bacterium]